MIYTENKLYSKTSDITNVGSWISETKLAILNFCYCSLLSKFDSDPTLTSTYQISLGIRFILLTQSKLHYGL